ncbi:hypothetical protein BST61_g153 [Cercospora zeina]
MDYMHLFCRMSPSTDPNMVAAAPAHEGYTPNPDHPMVMTQHRDVEMVLAIIGMIVSTGFMSLRLYTRAFISRRWGVDDAATLLAWMLSIALQAIMIYLWATESIGVHLWEISLSKAKESLHLTAISAGALYILTMAIAKLSLLIYYHKLSPSRWIQYTVYTTGILIIAYSTVLFLAVIFACKTVDMSWSFTINHGKCLDKDAVYLVHAGLNTGTTLLLFVIPVAIILQLEVSKKQKIGIAAMLSMGLTTLITSIVRLVFLLYALHSADSTWTISMPAIWLCVETNLLIICGCLPSMPSFFRHVAPNVFGDYSDDDDYCEKRCTRDRMSGIGAGAAASTLTLKEMANLNRLSKGQPKIFTSFEEWQHWWEKDVEAHRNKSANKKGPSSSKRNSQNSSYVRDERKREQQREISPKTRTTKNFSFPMTTKSKQQLQQDQHQQEETYRESISSSQRHKKAPSTASNRASTEHHDSVLTRPATALSMNSANSLRTDYSGSTLTTVEGSVSYERTSAAVPPRRSSVLPGRLGVGGGVERVGLGIYGVEMRQ